MKKSIDCNKITKDTKDLMFSLIEKSEKDGKEHFIKLCEDKNKNIVPSNVCTGISCMITGFQMISTKCPDNTTEIGNFHTHPYSEKTKPSENDIMSVAAEEFPIFCLGHMKQLPNKIEKNEWIETKKSIVDCYNIKDKQLSELGNKAHEASLKRDLELFNELTTKMSSRLDQLEYPKIRNILDKNCTLTETKVFGYQIKNHHLDHSTKRLIDIIRK